MTLNYDGVYEIDIEYTPAPVGLPAIAHHHRFDVLISEEVEVGTPFDEITVSGRESTQLLDVFIEAYALVMRDFFSTAANIYRAVLYHIPEGTYDKQFISAYVLDVDGTNAVDDDQPAHQSTLTFVSYGGGSARLQLMETANASNGRFVPSAFAASEALALFATGPSSPIRARDNTHLLIALAANEGQNERLWRKRYRNT